MATTGKGDGENPSSSSDAAKGGDEEGEAFIVQPPDREEDSSCDIFCWRRPSKRMRVLLIAIVALAYTSVEVYSRSPQAIWRAAFDELKRLQRVEDDPTSGVGPETCGQDREELATWFHDHGAPSLVLRPYPPLFQEVTEDPYDDPSNPPMEPEDFTGYCGMQWSNTVDRATGLYKYRLSNFTTEEEAAEAGYEITHEDHCGACSSLQDLGVYLEYPDLTSPTRVCGAIGTFNEPAGLDCMRDLGFSEECLSIWWYNVINTREECTLSCILAWLFDAPNTDDDGNLNKCLQCDEDESGPNFQYFAGRTRRNSGIPSGIDRPDEQIYDVEHCYWYGDLTPQDDAGSSAAVLAGGALFYLAAFVASLAL